MTKQLSSRQVEQFDLDGYLVIDNVLSGKECELCIEVFERYADQDFSAVMNLDRQDPLARELVTLPKIVNSVEQLQRWEVDAVMSQILYKKAGSPYASQAWNPHQDNVYPAIPYHSNITTNLFLTDADPDNGGLYLYPGSHREPLLPFTPTPSHREPIGTNPGNTVSIPDEYPKIDLVVRSGSVLVMNSHLIHGSYPNHSTTRSRPLYSVSYVNKGVDVPIGKNADRRRYPVRPHVANFFPNRI